MANEDIPILVVVDDRFSSAIITKTLRGSGFQDVRFTGNPLEALRSLEKRPAHVVIADATMASLDGLELTRRIKRQDDADRHFTHVMLLTHRDDLEAMRTALDAGVDDFLDRSSLRSELLPRVLAARRLAGRHNELLRSNRLLRKRLGDLKTTDLTDTVTGLGNLRSTIARLADAVRQAESRGGAVCLVLVGIRNLDVIRQQYEPPVADEVVTQLAARLRELVRPLDLVTRPGAGVFAVIMLQPDLEVCSAAAFRRIFDNLYMHAFETSEGRVPVVVGMSISAADGTAGFPSPRQLLQHAAGGLRRSFDTGLISVQTYAPQPRSTTAR